MKFALHTVDVFTSPLGKRTANGCFWLKAVYNKSFASWASFGCEIIILGSPDRIPISNVPW